jgi:hypothetical protein
MLFCVISSTSVFQIISGYAVTEWTVRPFSEKELRSGSRQERLRCKKWNVKHSRARIGSEHYFGGLKGRFPALKLMPGRDMKQLYRSVEALIILHNILLELNDSPHDIDDFSAEEIEAEVADMLAVPFEPGFGPTRNRDERRRVSQEAESDEVRRHKGVVLRNHLVSYMFSSSSHD